LIDPIDWFDSSLGSISKSQNHCVEVLAGIGKFATIYLASGNNTVTLTDTTLSGGSVRLHGGSSGNNTVSAASDTAASAGQSLTYYAWTGTDSFTGRFENDTVDVSAAAAGSDTLTGGSGTNLLTLTSAGTVNLGGVSKFAAIDLASGSNTVTGTDTTLSGGTVTIKPGAGNQTISAAGDTSASDGKSLIYMVGSGADNFTGGFENDTIYAGTGSGTYTAGSGSDSFVFIADNLSTQTLNNFQPSLDDILVYGIHASNGFDLGSTDNRLKPTTPTAIDPSISIASTTGDFTSSS
jgi:Ca2+-binding RTX toxin-like protein